jgi:transposase
MIPEAREVHLSRTDRKVLEACCRSPVTLQRDLKRAQIVLLAAAGRSTRSIAKEVGVQPRIVSLWRHRYADHGLEGLKDKPRPGKQPIYTKTTDKRILKLLDKPPPQGFARWTLLPYHYTNVEHGMTLRRYWSTAACQGCAIKSQCTPSKERRITRWEHEQYTLRSRSLRQIKAAVEI